MHFGAPFVVWFTGLPASGKTTLALATASQLKSNGFAAYVLDGDTLRSGLSIDLGFSRADRAENVRRAAEVAKLFLDGGFIVLCSLIAPFRADRQLARERIGKSAFVEVHVSTPLAVCMARDPKSLYTRALRGEIANMTGINQPYEPPENPDICVDCSDTEPEDLAAALLGYLSDLYVSVR